MRKHFSSKRKLADMFVTNNSDVYRMRETYCDISNRAFEGPALARKQSLRITLKKKQANGRKFPINEATTIFQTNMRLENYLLLFSANARLFVKPKQGK